jgi:hypothetical protein
MRSILYVLGELTVAVGKSEMLTQIQLGGLVCAGAGRLAPQSLASFSFFHSFIAIPVTLMHLITV